MRELIEAIAKALVDNPEQVSVRAVEGEQVTVLPGSLLTTLGAHTVKSISPNLNLA